ncbi:Sm-like protein [Drosera capensis]
MSGGGGAGGAGAGGGGGEKASASAKAPSEFLKSIRGRPVVVKLNSGVDYRGILACLDGYMNIAMEQTEEYVNGQLKNNALHQYNEEDCYRGVVDSSSRPFFCVAPKFSRGVKRLALYLNDSHLMSVSVVD